MKEESKNKMIELCEKMNISITQAQIEEFENYMKLLLEWNEKINLTAIIEEDEIILKHFIDSLTILKYIKKEDKIVDVGTGAGFPGIPLAIMQKENEFTLIDSLNKRINFLNEVKKELEIKNVKNIHARAEEIGQNKEYREMFDVATSRAVAQLNILVEYLIPLVKREGRIICMKGSNISEELEKSKSSIKILGGKIEKVEEFELPNSNIKRNIIVIKKIVDTPKIYPRKAGIPVKKPL